MLHSYATSKDRNYNASEHVHKILSVKVIPVKHNIFYSTVNVIFGQFEMLCSKNLGTVRLPQINLG